MTVLHAPRSDVDDALQARLDATIAALPGALAAHVHATVIGGVPVLTGELPDVPSWRRVRDAILPVPGVTAIADEIALLGAAAVRQPESAVGVARRLHETLTHRGSDATVLVDYDGGIATLWGEAGSEADKRQAVLAAWSAPGVWCVQDRIRTAG
jgi:osmotically-inducible protein OsmY